MPCASCGSKTLTREDISGSLICVSCGVVQAFDNYDAQLYGRDGPTGIYVHVGTAGTGSALNYKEKKIYESNKLIDELTFKLDLTGQRSIQIKNMIDKITDGEFGLGDWFPILIGACSYVVMRLDDKSLPISEVASVLNCDVYELGRMITRVVEFLNLKLPEVDIVSMFERVIRNSRLQGFTNLDESMLDRMRKQGVLLLNCAVKWFLTTGRRPMPVVVAVLVFVTELNGVSVKIENVAKEVHCTVVTCRKRYKELLEALVKVAQALPWGKDVTVKNVLKNALFVMNYMEMKSMEKRKEERDGLNCGGIDLGDVVSECLKKDVEYRIEGGGVESDPRYLEVEERSGLALTGVDHVDKTQLSHECLAIIYTRFANGIDDGKLLEESEVIHGVKGRGGYELHACRDWWCGKSELSKKVLLKKILEKDVGLDVMPPSFVNGCVVNERRRAKINAAKRRIDKIMNPSRASTGDVDNVYSLESVHTRKRKRKLVAEIDWEDLIIETLLLHQVKEEEIETGHYNTLLDLHVFNSGIM